MYSPGEGEGGGGEGEGEGEGEGGEEGDEDEGTVDIRLVPESPEQRELKSVSLPGLGLS